MASHITSADGVDIAYDVHGAGTPALVFVHGWSCDRSYWSAQVAALSTDFRVVSIDLAGHGESATGRARWTIAAFGSDVAALVDALDLGRLVLIGHSMGGSVILEAARRLRGQIDGLVWVDAYRQLAMFPSSGEIEQRVERFRADFVGQTQAMVRRMFAPGAAPPLVERVATDMSAAPVEVALGALDAAWKFEHEAPALLRELDVPVVAVNPAEPPSDADSLRRHGVTLVSMPGVGHFPMMEDAPAFNRILVEVVNGFDSARVNEDACTSR